MAEFGCNVAKLELPRRSFVGLESTHVATTGNGVVGDLYNSVQSGRRVTTGKETKSKLKTAENRGSYFKVVICL